MLYVRNPYFGYLASTEVISLKISKVLPVEVGRIPAQTLVLPRHAQPDFQSHPTLRGIDDLNLEEPQLHANISASSRISCPSRLAVACGRHDLAESGIIKDGLPDHFSVERCISLEISLEFAERELHARQ